MNMRITMVMLLRHTGHVSITVTRFAQLSQKRAYPQDTSANPSAGATKHTSQVVSAAASAAVCGAAHSSVIVESVNISPSLSSPAMSTPAKSSVNVQSCNFSVPMHVSTVETQSTVKRIDIKNVLRLLFFSLFLRVLF